LRRAAAYATQRLPRLDGKPHAAPMASSTRQACERATAACKQHDLAGFVALLRSHAADAAVQAHGCRVLGHYVDERDERGPDAAAAGAFEVLLAALAAHPADARVQEECCGTLGVLTYLKSGGVLAGSAGAIEAVIAAMTAPDRPMPDLELQKVACSVLANMTFELHENSVRAGAAGGVGAVLAALRDYSGDDDVRGQALRALTNLTCSVEHSLLEARAAGAVELVVATMRRFGGCPQIRNSSGGACTKCLGARL
jgi:hypothetical protein